MPTADSPAIQWLAFILFLLLISIVLGSFVLWLRMKKSGKGKRKRKHRHHRPSNPTLAQTGGLPPKRDPNLPPPGP
jgi:uncharacterized iron-regulated membrane protein